MLNTLACTMLMTLCIDTGLKDGEYVIQISPEQFKQMFESGQPVTSNVPPGIKFKKIRIQFGNEKLNFPDPLPATAPDPDTIIPTSMSSPAAQPRDPPLEMNPPIDEPIEPKPKDKNKAQDKPGKKQEADETESYLTTAILSWIVSAALLAMLVYLLWIYLDMRHRYQTLLNRTLDTPAGTSSTKPSTLSSQVAPLSKISQTANLSTDFPQASNQTVQDTFASAAEKPTETSTLKESETFELPEEEEVKQGTEKPVLDVDFEETDRLLENTNRIIAQAAMEASQAEAGGLRSTESDEENKEPETVFELPEASDDEPPEEEDLTKNWEGVE